MKNKNPRVPKTLIPHLLPMIPPETVKRYEQKYLPDGATIAKFSQEYETLPDMRAFLKLYIIYVAVMFFLALIICILNICLNYSVGMSYVISFGMQELIVLLLVYVIGKKMINYAMQVRGKMDFLENFILPFEAQAKVLVSHIYEDQPMSLKKSMLTDDWLYRRLVRLAINILCEKRQFNLHRLAERGNIPRIVEQGTKVICCEEGFNCFKKVAEMFSIPGADNNSKIFKDAQELLPDGD